MSRPGFPERSRVAALLAAVLALALGAGCSTLPDSGEVHTRPDRTEETAAEVPYFAPPGPATGDDPEAVVRGFLLAMQANPPSTAVARSFLSEEAAATWKPNRGTVVYDAAMVSAGSAESELDVELRGAHRLSPEGAWLDGTTTTSTSLSLRVVEEGGEWRIDNPPDTLAVPMSYFTSLFAPFHLYFWDRTGTVLVPSRVYVTRGRQTASSLVRGLLAGPTGSLRDVAVSAFPRGEDPALAVVVDELGIADVQLGPVVFDLSAEELDRMVVQLTWTLRQVPGINRVRLTVDGTPVTLPGGRTDVSVDSGNGVDPRAVPRRGFVAVVGGRVVGEDGAAVGGPFGRPGFALRSLTWRPEAHRLAAVSANGRRVFVAPDRGARSATRVRTGFSGGTDLLRPAYDRFGGLWVVDNTSSGAVVHLLTGARDRVLSVPGVTGRRVSAVTVTRDGARLVAALADGANPVLEISNIVRDPQGRVQRVIAAGELRLSGADLGPARDLAQNDATTVAVLTRPAEAPEAAEGGRASSPDQITYVELDGSPGRGTAAGGGAPQDVPGQLRALVATPDPAVPLRVITGDGDLLTLTGTGLWGQPGLTGVVAASFAQ